VNQIAWVFSPAMANCLAKVAACSILLTPQPRSCFVLDSEEGTARCESTRRVYEGTKRAKMPP
jgi:hypothetical protein